MSEYYNYGPPKSLEQLIDPKIESGLVFVLYHLIFNTREQLSTYEGHSAEDWEQYKRMASADLIEKIHDILDWAYDRPEYDYSDLIRPAGGPVENQMFYSYICKFRKSIERYREAKN